MKRGNKEFVLLFFLILLFNLTFISSNVKLGNVSYSMSNEYGPGASISGWMNITIINESANSIFSVYDQKLSLGKLLENNFLVSGEDYFCSTSSCNNNYASSSGEVNKSFSLNNGQTKLMGIKLTSTNPIEVSSMSFKISSDADESCSSPLELDFGNDNVTDWLVNVISNNSCSSENYGCYVSSQKKGTTLIEAKEYCEKISLNSPAAGIRIGADLTGDGPASFLMKVYFEEDYKECSFSISASGKQYCVINKSISRNINVSVCISPNTGSERKYRLDYEDNSPCGDASNDGTLDYDFSIFGQTLKYARVNSSIINDTFDFSMADFTNSYFDSEYANCSKGCILPIRIKSGQNQNIVLSDLNIFYDAGISLVENTFYNLEQIESKINMPYKLINLDSFKAPETIGNSNFLLKFNVDKLFNKSINVVQIPSIVYMTPTEVPAGVNVKFQVFSTGNISSYIWYFENSTIETNVPEVNYAFSALGYYTIIVGAKNQYGQVNKSFIINAISPCNYVNETLTSMSSKLSKLSSILSNYNSVKLTYLSNIYSVSEKQNQLVELKSEYASSTGSSEECIAIAEKLNFDIPKNITISERSSGPFMMNTEAFPFSAFAELGQEEIEANENNEKAIYGWYIDNIDITGQQEIFSSIYENSSKVLFSYFKFTISTQGGKLYLVIPGATIYYKGAQKNSSLIIEDASTTEVIEVIVPSKISYLNLPFYIAPEFSQISFKESDLKCNFNSKCEVGEIYEDCSDCKPWMRALVYFLIGFIIIFVLYIIAQEWYKKRYESFLFKNSDDLYNLIHFIDNAEKENIRKSEMFDKLKGKNWSGEQITFAYKRLKGERTGMFEIPLFRFFERKKVQKEISLRNQNIKPALFGNFKPNTGFKINNGK